MFRDSIHGYISIPKCFVDNIIDTEMFQRLRNIDQTGMRVLYPTAKHDRFSHSLGVYHLGSKAVNTILDHFSQNDYWRISSDGKAVTFWAENKVLFLLACLLHDIGHTPFSHALESTVLNNSTKGKKLFSDILTNEITVLEGRSEYVSVAKVKDAKPHEQLGAYYVLDKLREPINKIFKSLNECKYPKTDNNSFLFAEHYYQNTTISETISDDNLAFIARMILGLKYTSHEPKKQIRNCFIELLSSPGFDVDKLDYIIRDTKMSGISNIDIDTERLLNSLYIVTKTTYLTSDYVFPELKELLVTNAYSTSPDRTIHINGDFRGVIVLEKNTKVKITKGSKFVSLTSEQEGKIKYLNQLEPALFLVGTTIIKDSVKQSYMQSEDTYWLYANPYNTPFDIKITNAQLVSDFCFVVCPNEEDNGIVKLSVNGKCDIEILGMFHTESPVRFFDASLEGYITRLEIASNIIKDKIPTAKCYNEFSIGYKKQAINVIANVMEARDYLYLWVYAHHKVIYYANFSIPAVAKYVLTLKKSAWKLDYNHIRLIDDYYVWTKVKEIYEQNPPEINGELSDLCRDLFTRKYRLSLYKSLAEFDLLFEEISPNKRKHVKKFIRRNLSKKEDGFPLPLENRRAGYLSKDFIDQLKNKAGGKLDKIIDIVYVDASYESKRIDANKTLIVMKKNEIASLGEIPLLSREPKAQFDSAYYFYLYYRTESTPDEYLEESKAFKKVILDMAIENLPKNNDENNE